MESLLSPAQSKTSNNQPDSMEEKRLLDESFDSEASSRSRVSKLSDISNLAGRFANAGKICFGRWVVRIFCQQIYLQVSSMVLPSEDSSKFVPSQKNGSSKLFQSLLRITMKLTELL